MTKVTAFKKCYCDLIGSDRVRIWANGKRIEVTVPTKAIAKRIAGKELPVRVDELSRCAFIQLGKDTVYASIKG